MKVPAIAPKLQNAAIEKKQKAISTTQTYYIIMIKPLGNRVLVERVEAETKTAGGLFLPDTAKEKPQEAIVRAIGTGGRDKDGNLIPFNVAVNDKVLITKYGGTEVTLNGTTYTILSESDILAIID